MKSLINFGVTAMLVLPAVSCAQDRRPADDQNGSRQSQTINQDLAQRRTDPGDRDNNAETKGKRRLESVTWNSVKHELTWTISDMQKKTASQVPQSGAENYLINMDDATMTFKGETRRFSKEEAANVHVLMDIVAKYAVDSTVWWDDGQGEPLNGPAKDKAPEREHQRVPASDGNVAILHVAQQTPALAGISSEELETRIRATEQKLAALKELQRMVDARQLAEY